ncbi:MAG: ATP-binding cassette domain-containing protein [Treponema sp.]|jgi:peptide/nickel transport system ATP-binding protein|nr:ATP-binding cassette domain-containing protein [Treponema sp.]
MQIEAKNICFSYGKGKPVLDKVSFTLHSGERTALIGPSGCGKSTLARILAGYLTPHSGEVLLDGKPLPAEGYCPVQLIYQHPEKAVNPRRKMGKTLFEGWEPDDPFLSKMGIEKPWLERYPRELSGGEIQRFCIARALGPETRFIIADEMSTMLDVITQAQIWNAMLDIVTRRNLGLFVITHNPYLAEKIGALILPFTACCTRQRV